LYLGFYLITFFSCFHGLLTTSEGSLKSRRTINYKMVAASLWMLDFSTLQVAYHLQFVLDAFIYSKEEPIDTLSDMSNQVNVMQLVTFPYRCWIIYGRRWMVVICPIIMCVAEIACGIARVCIETTLGRDTAITDPSIFPLIITLQSLTLATNVITTSESALLLPLVHCIDSIFLALIVHRIWTIHSAIRKLVPLTKNNPLRNALVVLIESAAVYTASAVVMLVVYAVRSNAGYVVSDSGITFNLIIIRFARGT
ncbi:hypothetical protein DFS33DRAFT_1247360, partial [Desarmillaria ectypa]